MRKNFLYIFLWLAAAAVMCADLFLSIKLPSYVTWALIFGVILVPIIQIPSAIKWQHKTKAEGWSVKAEHIAGNKYLIQDATGQKFVCTIFFAQKSSGIVTLGSALDEYGNPASQRTRLELMEILKLQPKI